MARNLDFALRVKADMDSAAADVGALESGLDKIEAASERAAKGLNKAKTAADGMAGASGKATTEAEREAAALAKQSQIRDRLTKLTNSQRGQRILEAEAIRAGTTALNRQTISVGQYNMAMRQLPMQITDIVTGLASGQSPMMVLVQQGGQLKDSFGGVAPAARALLGAISPMAVVVTAGAAAFGAIALAAWKGYQEFERFERITTTVGDSTGITAGQFNVFVGQIDRATDTAGKARDALELLLQSGETAPQVFGIAGQAAVALSELTGASVEDATAEIQKLMKEPAKYSAELNKQYNFLTAAIYEQILALERQGDTVGAQRVAVEAFGDAMVDRLAEVNQNLGYLEGGWLSLKKMAAGAWDAMLGIGRQDTLDDQVVKAQEDLAALIARRNKLAGSSNLTYIDQENIERLNGQIDRAKRRQLDAERAANREREEAAQKQQDQANENAAIAAQGRAEAWRAQDREVAKAQELARLEKDIAAARTVGRTQLGGMDLAAYEAARRKDIEERYKAPKGPAPKKTDADRAQESAERELENLSRQAALLDEVADGEKRASEEARVRYEIEHGTYQAASASTKQQLLDAAKVLDAKRAEREAEEERRKEVEKTERAYEQLRDQLRTPAEVALDTAIERVRTLNAAMKEGMLQAPEYADQLSRIVGAGFTKAPQFDGLSPEIGGYDSEQFRLDQQREGLEKWYSEQLELLQQFRANKVGTELEWNAQELLIEQQHQRALADLSRAQTQLTLSQTSATFDSMAAIAKAYAGEQSSTYRALFAVSKGFAVAQAAVALAQNVAEASKAGFPQNIPMIAAAFAQGAQIAQLLSAAQYATGGRIVGPGTGTSDSVPLWGSAGEFMVRHAAARQPGAYAFLEDFNARGMAALGDWRGYADGGVISADPIYSAPDPSYRLSDGPPSQTNVQNRMRVYLAQDVDQLRELILNHPRAEKAVVAIASQNGGAIRAEW